MVGHRQIGLGGQRQAAATAVACRRGAPAQQRLSVAAGYPPCGYPHGSQDSGAVGSTARGPLEKQWCGEFVCSRAHGCRGHGRMTWPLMNAVQLRALAGWLAGFILRETAGYRSTRPVRCMEPISSRRSALTIVEVELRAAHAAPVHLYTYYQSRKSVAAQHDRRFACNRRLTSQLRPALLLAQP
jgi:hypothetical protein